MKNTWKELLEEEKEKEYFKKLEEFLDKEYVQYDKIIHQGSFNVTDTKLGKINFDDVYDGSSYDKENQKDGNDDGQSSDGSTTSKGLDGWSFNLISRDNITDFQIGSNYTIENEDVKDKNDSRGT